MAIFAFDATTVEAQAPAQDRTPLPAGMYNVMITATEVKETKKGNGSYIRAEYTVLDPEYARRKVWANFNIRNENAEAERIGNSQLASALSAMGLTRIQATEEMHNKPLKIKVAIRTDAQYGDSNDVKGFAKADPDIVAPTATIPVRMVANAPAPSKPVSSPPWAKK